MLTLTNTVGQRRHRWFRQAKWKVSSMARISGIVQTHKGTPLKAIVVSNGEAIVMTDAHGRFTLDADLAVHPFIMATRPDGYGGDG